MLSNTGKVTWSMQVRVRSLCDVDMTYFPFDDQLCSLRFGSWLYSDSRVIFNVRHFIIVINIIIIIIMEHSYFYHIFIYLRTQHSN